MKPIANIAQGSFHHSVPLFLGALLGVVFCFIADLPLKWLVVATTLLLLACLFPILGNARTLLLLLLPLSIPITFNYHIVYRPEHIGSSGITMETIDLWLFALLAMWLYNNRFVRHQRVHLFSGTTLPFAFLLLCGLLSFAKTNYPDLTLYGLLDLSRCFLLYFCLANNTLENRDRRTVFLGLQVSVLLLGAVSMVEALFQTNFVSGTYELSGIQEGDTVFRSAGLTTPTLTAGFLASMLPILFAQAFTRVGIVHRLSLVFSILVGGIGLLLTFTRGAFLSLAAGIVPLLIFLIYSRRIKLIHILLALAVSTILLTANHEKISMRLGEGSDNLFARYGLVLTAVNAIRQNPVLGMGLNTYHQEMARYVPNNLPHHFEYVVHSNYFLIWAEAGTFALIAFLALIVNSLRKAAAVSRLPDKKEATLSAGLLSSLIVTSIHMNFEAYGAGFLMQMLSAQAALIASFHCVAASRKNPEA